MLSSERRRAVKDLVAAALRCEPATRDEFIRGASQGDVSLSEEALRLLRRIHQKRLDMGSSAVSDADLLDQAVPDPTSSPADTGVLDLRQFHGTRRFEVRRRLGEGGFGEVYESYDRNQQQLVALKVLRRSDPAFLYRFKREFRALVDVRHPNLIELYELFSEDQLWFFTMELVRGVNFLEYVRHRHGSEATTGGAACSLERFRHASLELSEGIVALHSRGILHRDIKPGNVLVSANGRVRLLDFGLVHEAEISNAQSVMFAGTPAYMAPEQLAFAPSGTAADWYSFGVMLVQALTGATPSWENRFNHESARARLALLADIPEDLKKLCVELLDPDPTRRPPATVIRQRLGAPTSPPVGAVVADPELSLIGREPQLATLARLLDQTRDGPAVVVNLFGQSGIGKSTLLRTFRKRLARTDPDVVMLSGRCHENETVPFKALDDLVDGLSRYLKALPAGEADALAPRDAASLVRLFPVLAQVDAIVRGRHKSLDIVDAQELRQRAFASLQDLFARLAERKTVVLTIDDLQWGDLDSGAFLRTLFVAPSPPSLLLIASYRVEDVETSPFLKSWHTFLETADSFTIENMALAELTPAESEELATRHLSHVRTGAMEVAQSIAREASGSPFLIEQFARYMPSDTTDTTGPSIRRAIERRLSELPDEGRRLLETLAIAAQPLSESFAYVAAEWIFTNRPILFRLVGEHFLRVRETNESRQIEIYHDRLREMIVALMPPEVRQQRHRDLAVALERVTQGDPATLAIHHREAGDVERASQYAVAAGDQAAHALAFERAAQWYQQALDYGSWTRDEAIEVRRKLAETLAFAGRGPSAAEVYLKAAETAEDDIQVELQRLAAEQLLRAGHVDRGLAMLEDIARDLGIWLPPTRWLTLLSLLFHRLGARLPVFRRQRSSNDRDGRQLIILDVYWSFFIGLGNFDPIRAMDFQARHLALATRVGDPKRLAVSLAAEALTHAASGGDETKRTRELFAAARALCDATQAPEAIGFIFTMEAFCACLTGNWRRALDVASQAEKFLSEECSGVQWERATSIQLRATAVFHLGAWAKVSDDAKRLPGAIEEAKARGDVYGMVAAIPGGTVRLLAADQPALAQQFITDTIAAMPQTRFLVPNVWAFNLQVYIALYAGDPEHAWSLVESEWPALAASYFLRVEYVAIIALDVRARAAIAAARNGNQRRLLSDALRCARKLARKHSGWAHPISLLIRAGVASVQQQKEVARELLERAETEFRAAEMAHFVAACQNRRGTLVGGAEGQALVTAAEDWAASEGLANPRRVFEMLAPGRWECQ
jgi:eukaryotic-like serine/threonine-protein kinase